MEDEEGQSDTRRHLLRANGDDDSDIVNGDCTDNGDQDGGSSSATVMLVFSTFVAVCGNFVCGCTSAYSSPAESGIKEDLGLSTAEFAVFVSIVTVGGIIGAVLCGKAADILGRKGTMWVADIWFSIGWFSIVFANNAFWLDLGRLSCGIGFGLTAYAVPIYIAEIAPKNLRGALSSCTQFLLCMGASATYFLGTLISWRHLALVGCSGSLIQMVGLFFIPESPRWLAKTGHGNLEACLRRLRGKKTDVSREATDIQEYTETFEKISKSSFCSLFQRRYARAVIVGIGLMMLQQFSGITSIAAFASYIFKSAGFSTTVGSDGIAIIKIPAALLGIFLIDKCGRRTLLMISAAGMCFSCIIVGLSFLLQDFQLGSEITSLMLFIAILFYTVLDAGTGGVQWLIVSEIFPVNLKASAGTVVALSSWISGWAVTYSFSFLFDWSTAGVFFIFAAVSSLTFLFAAKLVPETKLRQIEEIQASMNHFI